MLLIGQAVPIKEVLEELELLGSHKAVSVLESNKFKHRINSLKEKVPVGVLRIELSTHPTELLILQTLRLRLPPPLNLWITLS